MIKNIPSRLEFAADTLRKDEGEVRNFLRWYGNLGGADRKNVYHFLKTFDEWVFKTSRPLRDLFYVVSGGENAQNYVNLGLITNNNGYMASSIREIMEKNNFETKRGEGDNIEKRILTLNPKRGSGKDLMFTIHPKCESEEKGNSNYNENRVVLYRKGNANGFDNLGKLAFRFTEPTRIAFED